MKAPANSPELEACMNKLGWRYVKYRGRDTNGNYSITNEYFTRDDYKNILSMSAAQYIYNAIQTMLTTSCLCNGDTKCSYHIRKEHHA